MANARVLMMVMRMAMRLLPRLMRGARRRPYSRKPRTPVRRPR